MRFVLTILLTASLGAQSEARWWSLGQLEEPPVPTVATEDAGWVANEIDAFVLARLREAGLRPSEAADRRTLIRRAAFDLHGLPPTPEEVEAFVNDPEPEAFERLVDRLLASPRYGERWGRHWLDVAHYADTHGYDKDKVRPNAWPYRDWVIEALNEDTPWRMFVEMQLVGDLHEGEGTPALGFLAAGPWDYVGHVELREGTSDKRITRNLDRDDMVTNVMSSFTSLTVHCARCHDHKFDPITQEDYYGLQAVFAGVERADLSYDERTRSGVVRELLEAMRSSLVEKREELDRQRDLLETEVIRSLRLKREAAETALVALPPDPRATSPTNGWHSAIMPTPDHEKWIEVDLGAPKDFDEVVLWPTRPTDFPDTPGFGFPLRYRVEVTADQQKREWRALADHGEQDFPSPGGTPVLIGGDGQAARFVRVTATRLWKRTGDYVFALAELEVLSAGANLAEGCSVIAKDSIEAGRWSTRNLVDGFTSRFAVSAVPPSTTRRRKLERLRTRLDREFVEERARAETELNPGRGALRASIRNESDRFAKMLALLPPRRTVFAVTKTFAPQGAFTPPPGGRPRAVHVLERGDVSRPKGEARPRALGCVEGVSASLDVENPDREEERRWALAGWLLEAQNPLIWRSIVNRVWHWHFGRGIVDTPNDFGRMGGRPSHPALLEWLAASFRDSGSLKQLHRLILTSSTWRQASGHDAEKAALDSGNRLLWRQNRRRLEAEEVRDSVLAVAGTLDLSMGGPGYQAFRFEDDHSPRYLYAEGDPTDRKTWRRSVYRFIVRSVPDPLMETLDCADPSRSVPVRGETVTALQALALLNNPFMLEQARRFAERVSADAATLDERVKRAFLLATGRKPHADEQRRLADYARRHGLPALCRLVFNLNEFLFID